MVLFAVFYKATKNLQITKPKNKIKKQYKTGSSTVGIYLLKVSNRNTRTRHEICSKLTIKTPERRHWLRSVVFIVDFEHMSHTVLHQ